MTKSKKKVVLCLVLALVYISLSSFMGRYYADHIGVEPSTATEKLLFKPLHTIVTFFPIEPTEKQQQQEKEPFLSGNEQFSFYIFFFTWPLFLLLALLCWVVNIIMWVILFVIAVLAMLLSGLLWLIIYILSAGGYQIF